MGPDWVNTSLTPTRLSGGWAGRAARASAAAPPRPPITEWFSTVTTIRAFFTLDWGNNVRRRIWNGFTESAPAERWVFAEERPHVRWDDWGAVGRWLAGKFEAADKPLGILAYSQGEAVRLLDAAQSLGIGVPDELGVVCGNDDPILLESQPVPVSAVDTDLERGAYEGAGLLDRLMAGEPPPAAPTVLPPRPRAARSARSSH